MKCPKCNKISGDDWKQCGTSCPMEGSPFYSPIGTFEKIAPEKGLRIVITVDEHGKRQSRLQQAWRVVPIVGNLNGKVFFVWRDLPEVEILPDEFPMETI
jgi:hypothetical protein